MKTPETFRIKRIDGKGMTRCRACRRSLIGRATIRPITGPLAADSIFCDQTCADRAHAPLSDSEDRWR
jgi:hypothetical protein